MIQDFLPFKMHIFAAFLLLSLLSSCAPHRFPDLSAPYKEGLSGQSDARTEDTEVEKKIREEFKHWNGTQHKLGGNDTRGIDCSGLVKVFYKKLFNIDLPRTAKTMEGEGVWVKAKDLRPGDLVFFRPPDYPYHVGIFLNHGEFLHSTKNNGVSISSIEESYWEKSFWTARRILPN